MISVFAKENEQPVVREFFELFKTPWEFFHENSEAGVLLCTQNEIPSARAKLVLIYAAEKTSFDPAGTISSQRADTTLDYRGESFPIYGAAATFEKNSTADLTEEFSQLPAICKKTSDGQTIIRVGYDLFAEIRFLLTKGQPENFASSPTLERHIGLLRDLIVGAKIPLVEIPPIPAGKNFIACLTHDVDHVGIRNHKCDHTMFGFLFRATARTTIDLFRGRKNLRQFGKNWAAAFSLPLVHLGLVKDFWYQFENYNKLEKGLNSTFFIVPSKDDSGTAADGRHPLKRATQYGVDDIRGEIKKLRANGNEIALHGIDAWRDGNKGRVEKEKISQAGDVSEIGVRMHWLYFNEQSPAVLEAAGFSYDSTVGYNQTIGYRAGTTQVFRPLSASKLLELPMHVMDTALFYPSYLNLAPKAAAEKVAKMVANVIRFGGVLTINWHDRSIAPERLWDDFYIALLADLKNKGAWFPTAMQAVNWFKKRRRATFEENDGVMKIKLPSPPNDGLPGLQLRTYNSIESGKNFSEAGERDQVKTSFTA